MRISSGRTYARMFVSMPSDDQEFPHCASVVWWIRPPCKLFEVYFMDDEPLTSGLQQELDGLIADVAPRADTVIVTDFGHGLIGPSSIDLLASSSRFLAVNTQAKQCPHGV